MSNKKMWFGNSRHAQWAPVPVSGMERTRNRFTETLALENGGAWGRTSFASHCTFDMEFPVDDPDEHEGIEAFERFASGEYSLPDDYGSYQNRENYLRFADPMLFGSNIFPAAWASPGLIETGDYPNLYIDAPAFSDTGANTYGKPFRKATWDIDSTSLDEYPPAGFATFIIPDGYTLHLGASGSVTGDGNLSYVYQTAPGTYSAPQNITMTADAAAPAYSSTLASTTSQEAYVYMRRTGSAGTVTITAAWATLWPTGSTPPALERHTPGKGSYGCIVSGDPRVESYLIAAGGRKLVGASFGLLEVEQSQAKRRL